MRVPRLAERLLAGAVPAEDRDMVLGDLEEAFVSLHDQGHAWPRTWYTLQAVLLSVGFLAHRVRERLGGPRSQRPGTGRTRDMRTTTRRGIMVEGWIKDARFALRALRRRPGFTAVAVLTLALGIGANTAIFSVIHGSLLRPLPYSNPDELVWVSEWYKDWTRGGASLNIANYLDLEAWSTQVPEMAAYEIESSNFATADEPLRIRGARISPEFFDVLGVHPRIGRAFTTSDDHRDAPGVVILTDELWRERFGADPDIVGKTVTVNAEPFTIVGVTPEEFTFHGEPRFFRPFGWGGVEHSRGGRSIWAIGRMATDARLETAWDELRTLYARLEADYPDQNANWTVWLETLEERILGANRSSLLMLAAAAGLVLLIACVNVANLLLVRAETRQRELALRSALGAGRGGLVPTFLGESLILACAGGFLGVVLAYWGVNALVALYGDTLARPELIGLDVQALSFALGTATLTGLLVGLVPLLRLDVARIHDHLREGARGTTDRRNRLKKALVVAEVALAVTLVAGSGLLIHSFWKISRIDMGLTDPESVLTFRVTVPAARYDSRDAVASFYQRLTDDVGALPGVRVVGLNNRTPLAGGFNITDLHSAEDPDRVTHFVEIRTATADYFEAAGIALRSGELWSTAEHSDTAASSVIVNETLARQLFPDSDPLGRGVDPKWGNTDPLRIAAVVADTRENGPTREAPPTMYLPFPGYRAPTGMVVVVRAAAEAAALTPLVRRTVRTVDPDLPVYSVRSLSEVQAAQYGNRRFSMSLAAVFAGLALLLGAVGIYGVMSFTVTQRTGEMGVRLALGASRDDVRWLVLGQALRLGAIGVVVGLAAAVVGGRLISSFLFEVSPSDPVVLAGVVLLLSTVCAAASYVPAWRATRVDPLTSMRTE